MKFCAKDDLSIFEFHDAEFSLVSFDGNNLVISASMVNIHKNTPQNSSKFDMEIASAKITFENFHTATYEPGREWAKDEEGNSYPIGPQVIFNGQEALDRIIDELKNGIVVLHFVKEEICGYSVGGIGIEPYFEIKFHFDSVAVCWDEYKKKAWYELHHRYQYDAILQTPNGDNAIALTINLNEEPVYYGRDRIVSVGCTFDGNEFWGNGNDHLWIDALADLQRKLPEGVYLKCCVTCRHGNLCPVGNDKNEVFCTKDVLIAQKSDLYFYTEDDREREKRSRQYFHLCESFQPQSDEFYTYNDYLYQLKEG